MLSPVRPSPAPPPPAPPALATDTASLSPAVLPPLSYLGAVHSLIHPTRGIGSPAPVPQPISLLPAPEWPFSLLAGALASAAQQPQIAQPPAALWQASAASSPASSLPSPSTSSHPPSARHPSASPHTPSQTTSPPLTAGDAVLRSYLHSARSSAGQCVSWLMAAEHRIILHTTASFYSQTAQQQPPPPPAASHKAAGKASGSVAQRRAVLQQMQSQQRTGMKLTEVKPPLLMGVGPGGADSNAPRDGEVMVMDEQPLVALRPHASSLWLQPARLSRQLVAFLETDEAAMSQLSGSAVVMSNVTAVPVDVWAVLCNRFTAGKIDKLAGLLQAEKVLSLSHLSKLVATHIQSLPPPPVLPPSALTVSAANSPLLATMQMLTANRAATAAAGSGQAYMHPGTVYGSKAGTSLVGSGPHTKASASHAGPASDMPSTRRGFMAAMALSPPLSKLLGHRYLSRPSVVRHLWNYIRSHNLQRATEKRIIDCDQALQEIMGTRSVTMFEMNTFLTQHLTLVKEGDVDWIAANKEASEVEDRDRLEDERTGKKKPADAKRKAEAAAVAKKRERDRAAKEKKRHDRESGRSKGGSSRDKDRSRDRDRSRSKKDKSRSRDSGDKKRKQKKRKRDSQHDKPLESAQGRQAEEAEMETSDDDEEEGQAKTAAVPVGEGDEVTDDDANSSGEDEEDGNGPETVAGQDADLSTQSEDSSSDGDSDDNDDGDQEVQRVEREEEIIDDNSMLDLSQSGEAGGDDDGYSEQSADDAG